MTTLLNQIDWAGIEADFAAGWNAWVANCDWDASKVSFEFRDGYEAAANWNETHGDPPKFEDAAEMAREYRETKESEASATHAAFAD